MTLFGTTLDGQQIFSIVTLIAILGLWILALVRERAYERWERLQKALRAQEQAQKPASDKRRGPWG